MCRVAGAHARLAGLKVARHKLGAPKAKGRPVGERVQRIGGAYCKPPLVHRLLMPRGMPSGVMLRSHTSA